MSSEGNKSGFLGFMTTLPGIFTGIAAVITAIAGLSIAFHSKPDTQNQNTKNAPSPIATRATNVSDSFIEVVRGRGQVQLTPRVAVQLVDVETLKGTSKVGEPPSHEFNKKLDDRDHVFIEIISRAGISGQTVQTILDMDQKGWVDFLDSLDKTKRDLVKDTPFAKFNVYVDDSKDTTYSRKYYFQGELVTVKAGDQIVKFELVNVNNTRQSVEPENVRIRLK